MNLCKPFASSQWSCGTSHYKPFSLDIKENMLLMWFKEKNSKDISKHKLKVKPLAITDCNASECSIEITFWILRI